MIKMAQLYWHRTIRVRIDFTVYVAVFMCFGDFSHISILFLTLENYIWVCAPAYPLTPAPSPPYADSASPNTKGPVGRQGEANE